jgi:V/A-type H+-transporting ATPase subunit I
MIPILINTSEPMLKVRVVTVKDYSDAALKRLQEAGVLHVEEAEELSPIDKEAIEREKSLTRTALGHINDILDTMAAERTVSIPAEPVSRPLDEIMADVTKLRGIFSKLTEKQDALRADMANLEEMGKYLGLLAGVTEATLRDLQYSGNYLFTNVLAFSEESYKIFIDRTLEYLLNNISASREGEVVTYFIARTKDRAIIENVIRSLGITVLTIPDKDMTLKEFTEKNAEILGTQKIALAKAEREIQETIGDNLEEIVIIREVLEEENERFSVLEHACEAQYVTLIEGWVPESSAATITSGLKDILDYSFIEVKNPTSTDKPPTKLRNPKGIRPFEVIVSLFSLPKYGDWDPTPSVAYFFAFFFGLMLNDMVYALGLLVLARFLLDKLVDDPTTEGTRLFRRVLYTSGGVALAFGVLSGTYLGDFLTMFFGISLSKLALVETIQTQLSDPISFIILSLIIGLIHLNIAHILGLVKGVKEKSPGMVLSKIGLFLVQIFGIPYLFKSMLAIELISMSAATYATFIYPLMLGVVLIIVGAFMQMGGLGAVFWIFDLTGILGDVMSYSRLAGVGLATFYLASSFNLLSDWVSSTVSTSVPGIAGIILAFIVGAILLLMFHVFNLLLSSLAAFIHSLRLCFVEFLLKFYEGGGREYAPFHLRLRREIVVGKKS